MDALSVEQQMKLLLIGLAEYLQTQLTDGQIRSYSRDLSDLGPENLGRAIAILKRDTEVWAGRFPLPAKIRSYLSGSVEQRAIDGARRIMACADAKELYELPKFLREAATQYGASSILERHAGQGPTVFAQLREILINEIKSLDRQLALEAADNDLRIAHQETRELAPVTQAEAGPAPEGAVVEARPSRNQKGRGSNRGAN